MFDNCDQQLVSTTHSAVSLPWGVAQSAFPEASTALPSVYVCKSLLDVGCSSSFLILFTVRRSPWMGDQLVARPLPTHTIIQNKRT
jgi:hypothetical protein